MGHNAHRGQGLSIGGPVDSMRKCVGAVVFMALVGSVMLVPRRVYAQHEGRRLLRAYLSLSDAYDTNVLKVGGQSADKGDNIVYVQPSLDLFLPFRFGADVDVSYTFTYLNYSKYTQYNTYYNDLNASINLYPVRHLVFGIADQYTVVPISPQLPTFAVTNITQANYLNPYIKYELPIGRRFSIDVRYDYIKADFPGSLGFSYDVQEPQINAVVLLDRYVKLKPGFQYISQTFTSPSLGTINQSLPYFEIDVSNGSKLSFTARYSYITFGFTNNTQSGNIYLAKVAYKAEKRLKADLYVDGSKAFDIFGRLYDTQVAGGLDLDYDLTDQLTGILGAQYLKLKYTGENYYTDAYGFDIGINYRFVRWAELFATYYYYDERPESSNANKYQDSRILAGIRAGLL
ncbi:MAG: outer membrane beta-barrel protein [Deltaproteobacteria bacterium]|nr:outer membrane beta-barrel protein [Deltaproteobacteria bacterium]MCL5277807.1 outer membrane beta-barrel protein [Deltaproteobacteria bacterium]